VGKFSINFNTFCLNLNIKNIIKDENKTKYNKLKSTWVVSKLFKFKKKGNNKIYDIDIKKDITDLSFKLTVPREEIQNRINFLLFGESKN